MSAPVEAIRHAIEPAVTAAGMVLEQVDVRGTKTHLVRVVIDLDENETSGVGVEQLESVTNAVSEALDENPQATASLPRYTLEVTSPGAERELTQPRHWRRSRTRLVGVRLTDGQEVVGHVVSADEVEAVLKVQSTGKEAIISYGEIANAKVRVDFKRTSDGASGQPGVEEDSR